VSNERATTEQPRAEPSLLTKPSHFPHHNAQANKRKRETVFREPSVRKEFCLYEKPPVHFLYHRIVKARPPEIDGLPSQSRRKLSTNGYTIQLPYPPQYLQIAAIDSAFSWMIKGRL
jgi:hypothetical protein